MPYFLRQMELKLNIKWEKRRTFALVLVLAHQKDNSLFLGDKQESI